MGLIINRIIKISLFFISVVILNSCLIVKNEEEAKMQRVTLSPKPVIDMSEDLVRSKRGDMISNIPKGWFFVNVEEKTSSDVFSVAVNPDYSLAAVFSTIKNSDKTDEIIKKEGLLGLSRIAFDKRFNKSGGSLKQTGKNTILELGTLNFGRYSFTNDESFYTASSVVFVSSINHYYEFSLIPLNFNKNLYPGKEDFENIFQSILATIQY